MLTSSTSHKPRQKFSLDPLHRAVYPRPHFLWGRNCILPLLYQGRDPPQTEQIAFGNAPSDELDEQSSLESTRRQKQGFPLGAPPTAPPGTGEAGPVVRPTAAGPGLGVAGPGLGVAAPSLPPSVGRARAPERPVPTAQPKRYR